MNQYLSTIQWCSAADIMAEHWVLVVVCSNNMGGGGGGSHGERPKPRVTIDCLLWACGPLSKDGEFSELLFFLFLSSVI